MPQPGAPFLLLVHQTQAAGAPPTALTNSVKGVAQRLRGMSKHTDKTKPHEHCRQQENRLAAVEIIYKTRWPRGPGVIRPVPSTGVVAQPLASSARS